MEVLVAPRLQETVATSPAALPTITVESSRLRASANCSTWRRLCDRVITRCDLGSRTQHRRQLPRQSRRSPLCSNRTTISATPSSQRLPIRTNRSSSSRHSSSQASSRESRPRHPQATAGIRTQSLSHQTSNMRTISTRRVRRRANLRQAF